MGTTDLLTVGSCQLGHSLLHLRLVLAIWVLVKQDAILIHDLIYHGLISDLPQCCAIAN